MTRIVVTGSEGQVATALGERAGFSGIEIVRLGRPVLDLARPETIRAALAEARPDVIVNAAAYTAVDQAESDAETAFAVNATGAGEVAAAACALGVPVIQISTDYIFDGSKQSPYVEDDATGPTGVYGASKLAGEIAVAEAHANHAILRTAWVYAPYGKNFVRTMLNIANTRNEVRVVADQLGSPTYAPDIANAVIKVAQNLLADSDANLRGVFHLAGVGEASWADFAETIFTLAAEHGGKGAKVIPIATAEYPTPARRPANSRLECSKLSRLHGVTMPHWRQSLAVCIERLMR